MTTSPPPLTRFIGQTERCMRALLEPMIAEAGLSFPQWTVLVFLHGAGPLTLDELIRRQLADHVASQQVARTALEELLRSRLVAPIQVAESPNSDDLHLALTAAGNEVFLPLWRHVCNITEALYGDLPSADLEATRRTLNEITRRATARLAVGS